MKKEPLASQRIINVGVLALARETGLSGAAVSMKMKAGKTPDQIRAEAAQRQGRAPASKPKPGKASPVPSGRRGPGHPPLASEYDMVIKGRERYDAMDDAKLRRAKALAERQEIENMLRRGELMPVAYARKWGIRFLMDGRDELLKGPSELADALAAEDDPLKVAAILRGWLDRVVTKFEQLRQLWEGDLDAERVA
jgi:hypothetical protein